MARYVFGNEDKPGERWKRRLLRSDAAGYRGVRVHGDEPKPREVLRAAIT